MSINAQVTETRNCGNQQVALTDSQLALLRRIAQRSEAGCQFMFQELPERSSVRADAWRMARRSQGGPYLKFWMSGEITPTPAGESFLAARTCPTCEGPKHEAETHCSDLCEFRANTSDPDSEEHAAREGL